MNFLPTVLRELLVASKRSFTYYSRCMAVAIAVVVTLGLVLGAYTGAFRITNLGPMVLLILGLIGFLYATIEGALITCDCLTEEKRDGTIGLLFLTDMSGWDIVLGKVMARTWHAFGAILAAAPAPALTFLLGGVDFLDFARMLIALVAILLLSASVGVFFSSFCRSGRAAMIGALSVVLMPVLAGGASAFFGATPGVSVLQRITGVIAMPVALMGAAIPDSINAVTVKGSIPGVASSFGWLLLGTIAASFAMLAMAGWILPRAWQDKPMREVRPLWMERMRAFLQMYDPFPYMPRAVFDSLLSVTPALWMAERRFRFQFVKWGGTQLVVLLALWLASRRMRTDSLPVILGLAALGWHYALKFGVAMQSCRALAEDMRNGELELLLTTGLSVEEIIQGHLLAIKRQFLVPVLTVLCVDLAFVATWLTFDEPWDVVSKTGVVMLFALVQVADMYALAWNGLWLGLKSAHITLAVRRSAIQGVLGQGSIFGTVVFGVAMVGAIPMTGAAPVVAGGLLIGLASDAAYCCRAYTQLHDNFRRTAMSAFEPRAPARGWWPFRRRLARA